MTLEYISDKTDVSFLVYKRTSCCTKKYHLPHQSVIDCLRRCTIFSIKGYSLKEKEVQYDLTKAYLSLHKDVTYFHIIVYSFNKIDVPAL